MSEPGHRYQYLYSPLNHGGPDHWHCDLSHGQRTHSCILTLLRTLMDRLATFELSESELIAGVPGRVAMLTKSGQTRVTTHAHDGISRRWQTYASASGEMRTSACQTRSVELSCECLPRWPQAGRKPTRSSDELPVHRTSRAKRHNHIRAEWHRLGHRPRLSLESDGFRVWLRGEQAVNESSQSCAGDGQARGIHPWLD